MEQPGGMISEECMEQGCALMCVAFPQSDCKISLIEEVGAGGMVGGCVGMAPSAGTASISLDGMAWQWDHRLH